MRCECERFLPSPHACSTDWESWYCGSPVVSPKQSKDPQCCFHWSSVIEPSRAVKPSFVLDVYTSVQFYLMFDLLYLNGCSLSCQNWNAKCEILQSLQSRFWSFLKQQLVFYEGFPAGERITDCRKYSKTVTGHLILNNPNETTRIFYTLEIAL